MCLRECTGSLTENTCAQPIQECILGSNVCLDGCRSDAECSNQWLGDHFGDDAEGMWTCNITTRHCAHPGVATASAGDPCIKSSDCERNGRCISETGEDGWPGGYCTKDGCLVSGNDCAGDGVCQRRRIGVEGCFAPCDFGQEPVVDRLSIMGHGAGCRAGYTCAWNGVDPAGTPGNGACVPGNYNTVTTSNTGAPCTDDADCYSPYGAGLCENTGFWPPSGYCTILDCGAPGMPADVCGPNTQCVLLFDNVTACLLSCTTAEDCSPGHACSRLTGGAASKVCFPVCADDLDCRTGETCVVAAGDVTGVCQI